MQQRDVSFVGRDAELGLFADELARARAGQVRTVFVEGQAGIGKTMLVRHFLGPRTPAQLEQLLAVAEYPRYARNSSFRRR